MAFFDNFGFGGLDSYLFPNPYKRQEGMARRAGGQRAGLYGVDPSAGRAGASNNMARSLVILKELARQKQLQELMGTVSSGAAAAGSNKDSILEYLRRNANRGQSMYTPREGYTAPGGRGIGGGAYNEPDWGIG